MSLRVAEAVYLRAPSASASATGWAVAAAETGTHHEAPSFTVPRPPRRSAAVGSPLAAGLRRPASPTEPRPVDTLAIAAALNVLVETYQRPLTFDELVLAGLRHMVRGDGRLTLHVEGGDLVFHDGETYLSRRRLPDTAALLRDEEAGTRESGEAGLVPGYLVGPAWADVVRDAVDVLDRARPRLLPRDRFTERFFGFLPEYLDPGTRYVDPDASQGTFGIAFALQRGAPVISVVAPGSPAALAGLEPGDQLIAVGGDDLRDASLNQINESLARRPSGPVSFTVERNGQRLTVRSLRALLRAPRVSSYLRRGVAVIRIPMFDPDTAEAVRRHIEYMRRQHPELAGVILDLRANGGGHVAAGVEVADHFLDSGRIVELRHPRASGASATYDATPGDIARGLPVVVLINGGSLSTAELTALALSENGRARLMGTTSGGKGSLQARSLDVPLRVTTGRYFGPRGSTPHGVGVRPHVCTGAAPDPCSPDFRLHESDIDAAIDVVLSVR